MVNSSIGVYRRLFLYIARYRTFGLIGVLGIIIFSLASVMQYHLVRVVTNVLANSETSEPMFYLFEENPILWVPIYIIVIFMVRGFGNFLNSGPGLGLHFLGESSDLFLAQPAIFVGVDLGEEVGERPLLFEVRFCLGGSNKLIAVGVGDSEFGFVGVGVGRLPLLIGDFGIPVGIGFRIDRLEHVALEFGR